MNQKFKKTSNIYTIYDEVAQEAGPPFLAKNDGVANRQYQELLLKNRLDRTEFTLHMIGEYDNQTMIIKPYDKIVILSVLTEEESE